MKMQQPDRNVATSNLMSTNEFTIATNAKSFKVISDSLYTNKPLAIIREYMNNAWDAHVDAGNTNEPVELHLPTFLEPWLEIRDSGIGLDHSDVMNIFTSYFTSTKENSNEHNGCLGLGSKSAFSYTDSFVVVACKDGHERTYSLYLSVDGIPTYSLLAETSGVNRTSGVSIKVNIKKHDVDHFIREAKNFLENYSGLVKVNIPDFQYNKTEYVMSGKNWKLRKCFSGYRHAREESARIIMGSVVYPLSRDVMEHYLEGAAKTVLECSLDISVPLGAVSIHPSREGLDYDEATTAALKVIFNAVGKDVRDVALKEINTATTEWEAVKKSYSVYSELPIKLRGFLDYGHVIFKGKKTNYRIQSSLCPVKSIEIGYRECNNWNTQKYRNRWIYDINRFEAKGVVVLDEKKRWNIRMNETLADSNTYLLIKGKKDTTQAEYAEVLEWLGSPSDAEVHYVSKMADSFVPSKTRSGRGVSSTEVLKYRSNGTLTSNSWANTEVDTSEIEVYMDVSRFKPVDMDKLEFDIAWVSLGAIEKTPTLYGIPASTKQSTKKDIYSNAMTFKEYLIDTVTEYLESIDDKGWIEYLNSTTRCGWIFNNTPKVVQTRLETHKATQSDLYTLAVNSECYFRDTDEIRNIRQCLLVIKDFKIPVDITDKRVYNITQRSAEVDKKYPMLKRVNSEPYCYEDPTKRDEYWQDIINYIATGVN